MSKERILRKISFIPVLLYVTFSVITADAQFPTSELFLQDITGKPIELKTGYELIGSPFFPDSGYHSANIFLKGGKKIERLSIKINLEDYSIYYKTADNQEMIAITPIERVEFTKPSENLVFINCNTPSDKKLPQKYYQLLADGDAQLLKLYVVDFTDTKDYGSATVRRSYDNLVQYYWRDRTTEEINKITTSQDLINMTSRNKKSQAAVKSVAVPQKVRPRNESDLVSYFKRINQ